MAASLLLPAPAYGQDGRPAGSSPDGFRTGEYRALWALEAVHAADAYALGYTGKGVRVAVIDDGDFLDHAEFADRVGPWTQSGPSRSAPAWRVGGHSTAVSGVLGAAKDGRGMHGIAYDASLVPIANETMARAQSALAIRDAIDRGARILNGSYGYDVFPDLYADDGQGNMKPRSQHMQSFYLREGGDGLAAHSDEVEALRYVAAHDAVMVYSAGNDFDRHPVAAAHPASTPLLPYIRPANHFTGVYRIVDEENVFYDPRYRAEDYAALDPSDSRLGRLDFGDVESAVIAVAAVGPSKRIASYSNRCGVAWRWCIAGPGGDEPQPGLSWESSGMYMPQTHGGYSAEYMVGTSFASPMVAGALAVTQQAFPYMTMRQIREIVLTSADRGGHLADRMVYGWGLLDLGRAVKGPVLFGGDGFAPIFDVDTRGHDSWWFNDIDGQGGLTKRGAGLLAMMGHNRYTGPTRVKGGTLAVHGSIARSALTVERGGTLAGSGTVGDAEIFGTVAPGQPGAALRVAGDYVQHAQGVYLAVISADGTSSDRIQVRGKARLDDAVLRIAGLGPHAIGREYTVLQAAGGIQGNYARLPDPYLFLDLEQGLRDADPTRYRVAVRRNATAFASAAHTSNQRAVAQALDTAAAGVAPFDLTVMATQVDGLARRFDRWSGEAHASTLGVLNTQSAQAREGMLGRARAMTGGIASAQPQSVVLDETGKATWAQYVGVRDRASGDGEAAGVDATRSGLFFGADMPLQGGVRDGARLGLMAGYTGGGIRVGDRRGTAKVDSYTLGGYGSAPLGTPGKGSGQAGATLRYGASYSWHAVSSRRDTAGLQTAAGRYKAGSAQVFGEAGLPYAMGAVTLEPHAGLAYVDTRRRAFDESGDAGLRAAAAGQRLVYSTLGLRVAGGRTLRDGTRLSLRGGAGWRHAYGETTPMARMRFEQGAAFDVRGAPLARDVMLLEAGATLHADRGMRLSLDYTSQVGRGVQSHAVSANAAWMF